MAPRTRPCKGCGSKHGPPTGKKCRRRREADLDKVVDLFDVQNVVEDEWEDVVQPAVDEPLDAMTDVDEPGPFERRLEARMSKLEKLVSSAVVAIETNGLKQDSEGKTPKPKRLVRRRESSSSSSGDGGVPEFQLVTRKRDGRAKRREPRFPQENYLKEGEAMTGLNTVILAGIRQVRSSLEEDQIANPVLKHLEFLLKKSTLGVYRHEAYIGYDRAVRSRADVEGIDAFGNIATEELATSFCTENLVSAKSKDGKAIKSGNAKSTKTSKVCRAYNEGTCSYRNCIFSHTCLACDESGHGKVECPKLRSRPMNK